MRLLQSLNAQHAFFLSRAGITFVTESTEIELIVKDGSVIKEETWTVSIDSISEGVSIFFIPTHEFLVKYSGCSTMVAYAASHKTWIYKNNACRSTGAAS
jgi:hypothetical protein